MRALNCLWLLFLTPLFIGLINSKDSFGVENIARARTLYKGVVEKVSDGDTITLLTADYERVKVRLYGLDAPENKQPYGEQSKAALKNILERQQVIVEEIDVDHYSRVVGLVRLDGQLVNLSMVAGGYAWLYPQYCKLKDVCRALSEAESTAKKKRLGLWETSAPMPPWDWRKAQRAR